jgi:hypothetical protein
MFIYTNQSFRFRTFLRILILPICFPGSGIRDGKLSGSGINISDHISESLVAIVRVKNT